MERERHRSHISLIVSVAEMRPSFVSMMEARHGGACLLGVDKLIQ